MYRFIKGKVTGITPQHIIVKNNGVGNLLLSLTPYQYKIANY